MHDYYGDVLYIQIIDLATSVIILNSLFVNVHKISVINL